MQKSLTRLTLMLYGLPALPLAALTMPVYIFLPTFYAENLGLGLSLTGTLLLATRLFDMVSDPVIGALSDRTGMKWGRRRPWIAAGAPLTLLGVWMLLVPPADAGAAHLLIWSLALYLGWTMLLLPLSAWGAELSLNYDMRSRIAAWREGFTVFGVLAALGLIAAFGGAETPETALFLIAVFVSVLLPVTLIFLFWRVPEPETLQGPPIKFREGLRVLAGNRPFRRLILAYLLNGLANGLPATLFWLFVTHILGRADLAGPFLFLYFLCGMLGVPLWTALSTRYSKHRVWCGAMLWASLFFLLVPFIGEGDLWLFGVMTVLTGLALGADLTLPASMQADVVDVDTAQTGQQRTGLYFALWSMATKAALALAAGLAFPALDMLGFAPDKGAGLIWLTVFYALVPIGMKLIAIALMWGHELDRDTVRTYTETVNSRLERT